MKLYAIYWKEDLSRLETGNTAWWIGTSGACGDIGPLDQAAIFTKEEVDELFKHYVLREHGVVLEFDV